MEQKKGLRWNSRTSNIVLGWCLVAPLLLWLLLTVIYPLCYTFWLSMQNQELLGAKSEFVWLETYKVVLSDKEFWNALKNSLIWTVGNSILQGIGGLTVGLLLNQRFNSGNDCKCRSKIGSIAIHHRLKDNQGKCNQRIL